MIPPPHRPFLGVNMTFSRNMRMALVFAITSTMSLWAYGQAADTAPKAQPAQEAAVETKDAGVAEPTAQAQADAGPTSAPVAAAADKADAPKEAAKADKKKEDKKKKFDWKESHIVDVANAFVKEITASNYEAAYKMGGTILREKRTLEGIHSGHEEVGI